ncbi:SDR family NAD(P)-dependent oxidoreductase [Limosilactobacillus vaginalis]|uniref:SDR family NAD(P)-dependent oxidoreductase n=1 Tax=Limosilactobacillus vaginalis TaxID=1633 RepID=UPI000F519FEC|nr:SDR family NAD(P)-dependent oxidoreductase [Limosilactobacillus vaginalis]
MAAALITGATGGLGRVLAFEHVRHGGDVILVDCHAAKLQALSAELRRAAPGQQVELVVVDFTAADAAQQVFAAVQAVGWPVDYLINNAGFGGGGAFVTRSAARDPAMVQVNTAVPMALLKLFLPGMVARGHGRILNVAFAAAWFPGPEQATYFTTKAYLAALGNALWYELKPLGIRVTTFLPGPIETGFAQAGQLTQTRLFAPGTGVAPQIVARVGYAGMMRGKRQVIVGMAWWMRWAAQGYP